MTAFYYQGLSVNMSEETITTHSKEPKQKDPRRVEAGKKLALISREAKARKKQERENMIKKEAKSYNETLQNILLVGGLVAFGGLIYYFKSPTPVTPTRSTTPVPSPVQAKRKIYSMDDD